MTQEERKWEEEEAKIEQEIIANFTPEEKERVAKMETWEYQNYLSFRVQAERSRRKKEQSEVA